MLRAAVSGSFHRHLDAISRAVFELVDQGVRVLSPADPRVVDQHGEFLFVASDRVRSVRLVQDRHLESIRAANFLWLVCPDGYVGQSASMEIGFAVAADVPVYASTLPLDVTLRSYVRRVPHLAKAIEHVRHSLSPVREADHFLIDPHANIEAARQAMDRIQRQLSQPIRDGDGVGIGGDAELVRRAVSGLGHTA